MARSETYKRTLDNLLNLPEEIAEAMINRDHWRFELDKADLECHLIAPDLDIFGDKDGNSRPYKNSDEFKVAVDFARVFGTDLDKKTRNEFYSATLIQYNTAVAELERLRKLYETFQAIAGLLRG